MAEIDVLLEMPSEPKVFVPKTSLISRASTLCKSNTNLYQEMTILKTLNKAKFTVYLANCKANKHNYAMKVFPFKEGQPHLYFKNESRFTFLNHPNVIKMPYSEESKIIQKGTSNPASYIVMEYAPYGDFYDFVTQYKDFLNEKIVRTYFKQLIEGLEYIHSKGVAHLDLKLENLLIGHNFLLKIADFDLSCFSNESQLLTKGTRFYRAPEIMKAECKNHSAADIYSAGILLFVLKSGGIIPHSEDILFKGLNLLDLLNNHPSEFWSQHCNIQSKKSYEFDRDFRNLFEGMVKSDPEERSTIEEIKKSKWYNGPTFTNEELKRYISSFANFS